MATCNVVFMVVDSLKLPLPEYFFKGDLNSKDPFIKENKVNCSEMETVLSDMDISQSTYGDAVWGYLSTHGKELAEKLKNLMSTKINEIFQKPGTNAMLNETNVVMFAPNNALHTALAVGLWEKTQDATLFPTNILYGSDEFAKFLLESLTGENAPWPEYPQALEDKTILNRACAIPFLALPKTTKGYKDQAFAKMLREEIKKCWSRLTEGNLLVLVDQLTLWLIVNNLAAKDDRPYSPFLEMKDGKRVGSNTDPEFQIAADKDLDIYHTGEMISVQVDAEFNVFAPPVFNGVPRQYTSPPTSDKKPSTDVGWGFSSKSRS